MNQNRIFIQAPIHKIVSSYENRFTSLLKIVLNPNPTEYNPDDNNVAEDGHNDDEGEQDGPQDLAEGPHIGTL